MATRTTDPERANRSLKLLDRYLGIPLVFARGLLKHKREFPATFTSVGLLATAAIGDTVLLSGIVRDLRRHYPDKKLIFFATRGNYATARLMPELDDVVELPIGRPLAVLRKLRQNRVDVLVDFGPWARMNALFALLSGARFTLGFRTAHQYRHYGYDCSVEHSGAVHELENHRSLVRAMGVESRSSPLISVDVPLYAGLESGAYIVFHAWPAGRRSYLKEWSDEYWCELAAQVSQMGLAIVLTGGPSDAERAGDLFSKVNRRAPGQVVNLAGRATLTQTAAILREAAAVVSVNTGIVHLAAAVGARVLSLNGPTSAKRWGPVGERAVSINADCPGCGYLNLGFEYQGQREDCMAFIKPERVLELLKTALEPLASREGVADAARTRL